MSNLLWFSVLMSVMENASLLSFGMLSQSSTLATLSAVSAMLKWKSSLFSLLDWDWQSPVCCLASRIQKLDLEPTPVIIDQIGRIKCQVG